MYLSTPHPSLPRTQSHTHSFPGPLCSSASRVYRDSSCKAWTTDNHTGACMRGEGDRVEASHGEGAVRQRDWLSAARRREAGRSRPPRTLAGGPGERALPGGPALPREPLTAAMSCARLPRAWAGQGEPCRQLAASPDRGVIGNTRPGGAHGRGGAGGGCAGDGGPGGAVHTQSLARPPPRSPGCRRCDGA